MLANNEELLQGKPMFPWKENLTLWAFALTKVPLIALVRPWVVKINAKECEVKIPLNYLTRNHLKSLYFGTLAVGADCAGGLMALDAIRRSKKKVQLVFKDMRAHFLKRPESDTHFICKDGEKIRRQVREAIRTRKRITRFITVIATTPKVSGDEPVAEFKLGLSLKAE